MSKKEKTKIVIVVGGIEHDIVRDDGKYWYTETSKFRKLGGYAIKEIKVKGSDD